MNPGSLRPFGHDDVEKGLHVPTYIGIGVFVDGKTGRGMGYKDMAQANANALDTWGDFMGNQIFCGWRGVRTKWWRGREIMFYFRCLCACYL